MLEKECIAINDKNMDKRIQIIMEYINVPYEKHIIYTISSKDSTRATLFHDLAIELIKNNHKYIRISDSCLKIDENNFIFCEILGDTYLQGIQPTLILLPGTFPSLTKEQREDILNPIKNIYTTFNCIIIWFKNFTKHNIEFNLIYNTILNDIKTTNEDNNIYYNKKILKEISNAINKNKNMRFWQILFNLNIIQKENQYIKDDFFTKSKNIFLNLNKKL